jgi:CheY-like chemotaxis protein
MNEVKRRRLLVVDDDRAVRTILGDFVEALGHDAVLADGGEEGLARFEPGRFDLVLTDLVMPRMNGLQLGRELRRRQPDIRIIVISGSSGVVDVDAIRAAGFVFLPKPVTFAEFQATVEHELGLELEES